MIDHILSGQAEFTGGVVGLFRIGLGLAFVAKFAVETRRGHHRYLDRDQYLGVKHAALHPKGTWVNYWSWRTLYALKLPSALLLLFGIAVKLALLVLILSLAAELRFFFKYHANFMMLQSAALLLSKSASVAYSVPAWLQSANFAQLVSVSESCSDYIIVPVLLYLTMCALYFFAAFHKLNDLFLSGRIVSISICVLLQEARRRKFFDVWLPRSVASRLMHPDGTPRPVMRPLMVLLVACQLLIPVTSLFDPLISVTIVLGLVVHAMTTMMLPSTLIDFTIASVSSYVILSRVSLS